MLTLFKMDYPQLEERAKRLRKEVIDLTTQFGDAHFGGEFSEIEILVSLFRRILKPEDKFILSKGHACHPLYVLLKEKGYFPKIAGHPDLDLENGISCTTGSLGHGLPMGIGMALARKKIHKAGRIYVLMGDGECQEGTTWESALIAHHHQLNNLVAIIDRNDLQALDDTKKILDLGNLEEKFRVFGWDSATINGHSFKELIPYLEKAPYLKPVALIANTIKGKGISFMENDPKWHARDLSNEERERAYGELK